MNKSTQGTTKKGPRRSESLRFWQGRSIAERFAETYRLSVEAYGLDMNAPLDRTLVRYNAASREE